jgi:ubiquinone/menaquinone biosynthesis C-methylase UbiE
MRLVTGRKDHTTNGLSTYVKGMDKSIGEKEKLLPYVKEGIILEIGCGAGAVTELLAKNFPKSTIIGIDNSEQMIAVANKREYSNPKVHLFQGDVLNQKFKEGTIDTVVMSSVFHEIYSYNNYDMKAIFKAISNVCAMLVSGGRLIIRDGVMPTLQPYYLKFVKPELREVFEKFAKDFVSRKIHYSFEDGSEFPKLNSADAYEFLSKYFYSENWNIEVKEQFGIFTVPEYCNLFEANHLKIVEAHSYLIEFLKNKYEKEVWLLEKNGKEFVRASYPDSTAIIVGEKI